MVLTSSQSPSSDARIELIVVDPPRVYVTAAGDMREEDAARYLSYRTQRGISVRTLQRWRGARQGPVFHRVQGGRRVWYRQADLDDWVATCAVDPLDLD